MPIRTSTTRRPSRRKLDASLVREVYESLLRRILTGAIPPGIILSEAAVARQMGVSRTPVHDALRQLAKDGLIEQQHNRRARVIGFSGDDAFEIFEMRKLLEGQAAELATVRMDARHLAPLRAAADALADDDGAADWVTRWADFDEQFHDAIARASGNRRLAADIARYRLLHRGFNIVATDAVTLRPALAEHLGILEALEARDSAGARRRMVEHISTWQTYFIRHWSATAAQGAVS